jgi:uncharacterized membrane protein required for colicin V production
MIAAATAAAPQAASGFTYGWFDLLVLVVLGFGLFRGRCNGMSKELLPVLEWLVLVPLCALVYPMIAGFLGGFFPKQQLWNCVAGYVAPALLVLLVFKILKHFLAEKLVQSNFFKGGEYYLGVLAGMVRYACVLMSVLALLNAPAYTPAEIAQMSADDKKNFGGGLFDGNYFPHLFQVQDSVFKQSFVGPLIKDHAGMLLINSGDSGAGGAQPEKNAPLKPKPVIKIGY